MRIWYIRDMKGKLTKTALGWKADVLKRFPIFTDALVAAVNAYNSAPDETSKDDEAKLFAAINKAQADYNGEVKHAQDFIDNVKDSTDKFFKTRPTAWQEGTPGSDYATWREEYEDVSLDNIDIVGSSKVGDEIKLDESVLNHAEIIAALPEAVTVTEVASTSAPKTEMVEDAEGQTVTPSDNPETPSPEAEAHAAAATKKATAKK